ncbi:hypothetical protein NCLIV_026060 [Neospora caninum Liverpool]|uniref:Uncharacterized protein n=1 Tax=Neospora caninum (strain Liverpool) TaxID=572307 RepID=F0VGH3_NEOCL|nr:hypothetical protein NCLIV_026060 [Neospora caninum Liverpool]CBZ52817.1 hypothetical protein NCLIV_026060 [Neospora caninum Liverpool]|eukprot:XP_003882849.1 hypothetical protein NCLIV_026060 [Neospora caninum Liverpool]
MRFGGAGMFGHGGGGGFKEKRPFGSCRGFSFEGDREPLSELSELSEPSESLASGAAVGLDSGSFWGATPDGSAGLPLDPLVRDGDREERDEEDREEFDREDREDDDREDREDREDDDREDRDLEEADERDLEEREETLRELEQTDLDEERERDEEEIEWEEREDRDREVDRLREETDRDADDLETRESSDSLRGREEEGDFSLFEDFLLVFDEEDAIETDRRRLQDGRLRAFSDRKNPPATGLRRARARRLFWKTGRAERALFADATALETDSGMR